MVQFERALVSFYRLSIVTFPLSLRVSEILPLMFSRTPLFHYPTSSLLKISPCSRRTRFIVFLAANSEGAGLIVCTISFQDFQPMWSQSTNVTDGRTDGQTDGRHAIPIPRILPYSNTSQISWHREAIITGPAHSPNLSSFVTYLSLISVVRPTSRGIFFSSLSTDDRLQSHRAYT